MIRLIAYPFHVDEVLFGGHEEVKQALDKLGLLHHIFKARGSQKVALQNLVDYGPVPLFELFLLQHSALLYPQVKLLIINL